MMTKEYNRMDRIADTMQRYLAEILQRDVADPRLKRVSISRITVSKDCSAARVYIHSFADDNSLKQTLKILNKAASHIRYQLAQKMELRITPQLHFVHDEQLQKGSMLSSLIDAAVESDKAREQGKPE